MINKFNQYIKEDNNNNLLEKIKDMCEDSIQDLVDQGLDKLGDDVIGIGYDNWGEYWDKRIGWYKIRSNINQDDYYTPTIEVIIEFTIHRNRISSLIDYDRCINGLMHRLDMTGFIVEKKYDNNHGSRITTKMQIKAITKNKWINL